MDISGKLIDSLNYLKNTTTMSQLQYSLNNVLNGVGNSLTVSL